mmetsp:Transcript_55502/g.67967  ORF Transcript_55502/g.67967 Transcript_55502/m.67967 type:complete len:254 (-) Transcript_55502:1298-2059(-)
MSRAIKQPKSQVLLTNVAISRIQKGNKRFEVACYKNKLMSWRKGTETNIDEVIQIERVFRDVSKGIYASSKDMEKFFGKNKSELEIIKIILDKGTYQVSKKERNNQLQSKFKEIVTIIYDKCLNSETKKPFPMSVIEQSIKDLHFSINIKKSSKTQALALIKLLQKDMPIERAQMKLKIEIPKNIGKKIKPDLLPLFNSIDKENFGMKYIIYAFIDPGKYRQICDYIAKTTKGKGNVEVLDMNVQSLGDQELL